MSNLRSHLTKSDFILILFLLFIGIGITVWIYYPKSTPASTVEVRENGKLILSLPLSENTKQTIRCTDGGSNQLLIQDGAVTMTDADCDDKTCVKTGSIKENGTVDCLSATPSCHNHYGFFFGFCTGCYCTIISNRRLI